MTKGQNVAGPRPDKLLSFGNFIEVKSSSSFPKNNLKKACYVFCRSTMTTATPVKLYAEKSFGGKLVVSSRLIKNR